MPAPGKMGYWYVEPPVDDFPNPGFENGTISWQILNTRVLLNGGTSILGWPTPTDPTPNPSNSEFPPQQSPGDAFAVFPDAQYTYSLVSDAPPGTGGTAALKLESSATVNSGAILYGPAVFSERRITAAVGDTVEFSWKALSGANANVGDAYNPFAYMLNRSTGQTITLLDENATGPGFNTNWQTSSRIIQPGEAGEYHFIFICGSFDATFGQVIGSALLVDNIRLIKAV
jgi:hypothetical protein